MFCVVEKPRFEKAMEHKETIQGETTVLECLAQGSPSPKLNWTKDGGPLISTERHFFTADDQLLIIVHTKPTDAGKYKCVIYNELGSAYNYSILTVLPGKSCSRVIHSYMNLF